MQLPINLSKGKRMSLIETAKVEKALALCQDAEYEVQHLNKEKNEEMKIISEKYDHLINKASHIYKEKNYILQREVATVIFNNSLDWFSDPDFFHLTVELFEKEYISALLDKDDDLPIAQAIMKTELFSHDLASSSIITSFVALDTTKIPTPAIVIPSCASKDQLNDLEDMLGKYIDAAQQYAYIISQGESYYAEIPVKNSKDGDTVGRLYSHHPKKFEIFYSTDDSDVEEKEYSLLQALEEIQKHSLC